MGGGELRLGRAKLHLGGGGGGGGGGGEIPVFPPSVSNTATVIGKSRCYLLRDGSEGSCGCGYSLKYCMCSVFNLI